MKDGKNAPRGNGRTREYRAYRRLFIFFRILLFPFIRIRQKGLEHVPKGPVMLCANHSSNLDPVLLSLSMGLGHHPHYMAKIELFRIPVVAGVLRAIGSIPVNRARSDIASVKRAMRYLKAGEMIGIFPEGTRVRTDDGGEAKRGAVQIAEQMSVPVVPVYIPRKKRLFDVCKIVIGQPYDVNPERRKLTAADYHRLSEELMEKITQLQRV